MVAAAAVVVVVVVVVAVVVVVVPEVAALSKELPYTAVLFGIFLECSNNTFYESSASLAE